MHKAWADASDTIKKIEYPMLADPTGELAKFFGVRLKEKGQALRGTFIINPDGKIKAYEVHDLGIGRNAEELLRKVQAAQYVEEHGEQVCPAKWKPGEEKYRPMSKYIFPGNFFKCPVVISLYFERFYFFINQTSHHFTHLSLILLHLL